MLNVKVLGPGCRNCETLARKAADALTAVSAETPAAQGATIEKLTDYAQFAQYGLLHTPGLVINEKLVSAGRIPDVNEIKNWLVEATAAA